jgi:hypothetical protein
MGAKKIPAGTPVQVGHGLHPTLNPTCCDQLMEADGSAGLECRHCRCRMTISRARVVVSFLPCRSHS